jgi:hypothetical protein
MPGIFKASHLRITRFNCRLSTEKLPLAAGGSGSGAVYFVNVALAVALAVMPGAWAIALIVADAESVNAPV